MGRFVPDISAYKTFRRQTGFHERNAFGRSAAFQDNFHRFHLRRFKKRDGDDTAAPHITQNLACRQKPDRQGDIHAYLCHEIRVFPADDADDCLFRAQVPGKEGDKEIQPFIFRRADHHIRFRNAFLHEKIYIRPVAAKDDGLF